MTSWIMKSLARLYADDVGQGLVEYALIIALMCFAAAVAMKTVAANINDAFVGISSVFSNYVP